MRMVLHTKTAIIAVHDEIARASDSGDVCGLVLLDLSVAFVTVDHQTLLRALNWCESYLCHRRQTFQVVHTSLAPLLPTVVYRRDQSWDI